MKIIFYILSFLLVFFNFSCNQKPNIENRYSNTSLSFPMKYKLLEFKSDWDVGETTEEYKLLISKVDYKKITKEIENKKIFKKLINSKRRTHVLNNSTNTKNINESVYSYDNKLFYEIFIPNPASVITVILENDSIMNVIYNDL